MTDVARLAGVSHQTVSRVVNDSALVAEATRTRVENAMRALDYRPSAVARALATGRSRTIGVIGFDTTLHGPASTLHGIERAAYAAEYLTSVVTMPKLDYESAMLVFDRLRRHDVEGVLAVASHQTSIAAIEHISMHTPVVCVQASPESNVPSVTVDERGGAYAATQHLLRLGHRNVLHVAGPKHWQESDLRMAGWRLAMNDAGLTPHQPLFGDWSAKSGYELASAIGAATAVFCANDQMALGVMRGLAEQGIRIPEEISVVGYDDMPESAFLNPPLTTVRQDFIEVGRQGFELLRQQICRGESTFEPSVISCELVVRASTALAP